MRHIVFRGDPVLRKKSPAAPRGEDLSTFLSDMRRLMKEHDGVGIAAPQVGVAMQLFVVARDLFPPEVQEKIPTDVFVNPKVLKKSFKRVAQEEGCLSVPEVFGEVDRHVTITVESFDEHGKKFRITATDLLARVLQHEIDHLNGTLFVDKAKKNTLHELLSDGSVKPWSK